MQERDLDFVGALDWCGCPADRIAPAQPTHPVASNDEAAELHRRVERARRIWESASDLTGTLAETYLTETRNLRIPADLAEDVFRFSSEICWQEDDRFRRAPALVALFRDLFSDRPCGVRCTPLTQEGQKVRAPLMFGRTKGAAIKLTPDCDVTTVLAVTEGVETGLRIMSTGFRPLWVLGSAGALRTFPPLKGIEALTIFGDHDHPNGKGLSAGLAAMAHCRDRWVAAQREVITFTPRRLGDDWDDALRGIL
jgi:hypothetical protein